VRVRSGETPRSPVAKLPASGSIEPILQFLWESWDEGEGAWRSGFDEGAHDLPEFSSRDEFLSYFPDERQLDIESYGEELRFMDPFDPDTMGVPEELHHFYVEQEPGHPGTDAWYL
jgi:hypothetical protein